MKRFFLIIALAVLGTTAAKAQVTVYAGYENAKYTYKGNYDGSFVCNNAFVGAGYDISLSSICKGLGVETGVYFYYGGNKDEDNYKESRIAIPAYLTYSIPVKDIELFPFGGFSFNYGLLSKSSVTVGSITTTTDWYNDLSKRFDVTADLGFGITIDQNYCFYAQLYKGLVNTSKSDKYSEKSSGFEIGFGYSF